MGAAVGERHLYCNTYQGAAVGLARYDRD
eukprot:SAG31_NODE_12778_length_917_cov_21.900978_1_plen_28_part_01